MKYTAQLDPMNRFSHINDFELKEMLGILPYWVVNDEFEDVDLRSALDTQYGFGLFRMTGGTINKDGVYSYPQDEDLYPLVKIIRGKEIFYQYNYAIVAIIDENNEVFITRMD